MSQLAMDKSQFEDEGYVVLRQVLDARLLDSVRLALGRYVDRLAEQLLAENKVTDLMKNEPFETRLWLLYQAHINEAPPSLGKRGRELHDPEFFELFFNGPLLDLVSQLLGEEIRLYPNYQVRPKLPGWAGTEVLWHQDGGYTGGDQVEVLPMVNVWTSLVPAREDNGCMQFIPGTHKLGLVPHEPREYYLEIRQDFLAPCISAATPIVMDPGDVVLFSNMLFHRGLPNKSAAIRWSVDWRYEDATYPTMRDEDGHIARSRLNPTEAVEDAADWSRLSFR
jgi:phytanoyl-CoA hydroxylase